MPGVPTNPKPARTRPCDRPSVVSEPDHPTNDHGWALAKISYWATDPSRFLVDAGLAQLINANCHVLKMSAGERVGPKNHKHLSLRAARGFLDQPIDLHSF